MFSMDLLSLKILAIFKLKPENVVGIRQGLLFPSQRFKQTNKPQAHGDKEKREHS